MIENDVTVTTKYGRQHAFAACPDAPGTFPPVILYMDAPGYRCASALSAVLSLALGISPWVEPARRRSSRNSRAPCEPGGAASDFGGRA